MLKKGLGHTKRIPVNNKITYPNPDAPVVIELRVIRKTGDTETYELCRVPSMMHAITYRRRVAKVAIPKKIAA